MNAAFIFKEWKENRWTILVAFIVLGATTLIYPVNYRSLFAYLLQQGVNYEQYLWNDWFLRVQPQIVLIAAVVMGSLSMAREKRNSTLGILVTKPVSHANIVIHKLLAGSLALIAVMTLSTFILTVISPIFGARGLNNGILLLGLLGDILLVLPVYFMAAALSVIFMNGMWASITATAVIIVVYAPVWLGSDFSAIWWLFGNFGMLNPACAAVLAAAAILFALVGILRFRRIDV